MIQNGQVPTWWPDIEKLTFPQVDQFTPGEPGSSCQAAAAFWTEFAGDSVITLCRYGPDPIFSFGPADSILDIPVVEHALLDEHISNSVVFLHEIFHAVRPWDDDYTSTSSPFSHNHRPPPPIGRLTPAHRYLD
ncbi:hypothetical protein F4778DRAFT_146906 [Xylariomycetidae sp. FL2044]|nr:hypothetical protein F4778DRAFT_146906 [Xylariomycetidae sp. FL2044]